MNRKLTLALLLSFVLAFGGTAALAADDEIAEPTGPIEVSDDSYSEDNAYFPSNGVTRALGNGTLSLSVESHLVAKGSGGTYATEQSALIRFTMSLYKYDPNTGSLNFIDYQKFHTNNAWFCIGSHNFNVPSTGYYILTGTHTIGSEQTTTQTGTVYVW